jgi:hypothetical protein
MPLRCLKSSDEKALPFKSSLTTNTSMHMFCRKLERELLLSLIATRWIVEAGEVDGDGGGGWRRGVVCIVL